MTIYLDIETLDFFQDDHIKKLSRRQQLAALRFGLAATYDAIADEWRTWYADDLMDLWLALIEHDGEVIGWNIVDFDLPVIEANLSRLFDYDTADLDPVYCYDIFAEIKRTTGRWYKLDLVAKANLGRGKISHGQQAAEWIRSGDPAQMAKAAEYCRDDVRLVIDLHQLLRSEALRLPARAERDEINDLLWRPGEIERLIDERGIGTR